MENKRTKASQSERQWVKSVVRLLEGKFADAQLEGAKIIVTDGKKLPYNCEVFRYRDGDPIEPITSQYETDMLIYDQFADGSWIPRVVIECKLGSVTTHDALTYSAKAASHKQVHPYLRYGIFIGLREGYAIPGRLFRHGTHFDFMATWAGEDPSKKELEGFVALLIQELESSRQIEKLLSTNRSASRQKFTLVHRPLIMQE